ncbi:peptidase M23 [Sphingobacteriales bacterium UPWRP_1]|nr:hypothetical protein B6N25_16830 [Sphingobacteriales bacterium TSM_CSS]PSJ73557.1 peptidase M23 [Sphingobacteriales bacterium UPWRP_1]
MKQYIGIIGLICGLLAGTLLFQFLYHDDFNMASLTMAIPEQDTLQNEQDTLPEAEPDDEEEQAYLPGSVKSETEFLDYLGLPVNGYAIHEDVVKKNEVLSDILGNCNVPYSVIDELVNKNKKVFDPKNIKPQKTYFVLCNAAQKATFWVYEETPTNYIIFDLRGTPYAYSCEKDIITTLKLATGIIHNSLYVTLSNNNLNPALASELAKVFAYSVDFFKLQKGDKFKAIFEEHYVDGQSVGIGNIKAAYFEHRKEPFYAFIYNQDDYTGYFDEDGKSLKKAFLKSPLKFTRISSKYTQKRFHPILKRYKPHLGTDYAAPPGTPVMTIGDGTIVAAAYSRGNGNFVKVQHNGTYTTQYLHLSRFGRGIKRGVRVKQGQVIGYVGSTGLATGPHLCFRFWKNGKQVDPYREKPARAEPVRKKYLEQYRMYSDSVKQILDTLKYQIQTEDFAS